MRVLSRWLFVLFLFCVPPGKIWALTIDEFNSAQQAESSPSSPVDYSLHVTSSAVGGTRAFNTILTGGSLKLSLEADLGALNHSQDSGVTGSSLVTWDGDNDPAVLSPNGLGGIDFTQDNGTAIQVTILAYDPGQLGLPIDLKIVVYDASDPTGESASTGTITLLASLFDTTFDLSFTDDFIQTGLNGPADFTNVGAIQSFIDGVDPAVDLALEKLDTNGICEEVPDENGRVIDECGICSGPGEDTCGLCPEDEGFGEGPGECGCGIEQDHCGECGGNGTSCLVCAENIQLEILAALDNGAKKQERLILNILNRLRKLNKRKKIAKYIEKKKARAFELQIRNWNLSWDLPVLSVVCEANPFCIQVSNDPILDEYQANSIELKKIARGGIKRLKRAGSFAKWERKRQKKAALLHNENMEIWETVPKTQSVCS